LGIEALGMYPALLWPAVTSGWFRGHFIHFEWTIKRQALMYLTHFSNEYYSELKAKDWVCKPANFEKHGF